MESSENASDKKQQSRQIVVFRVGNEDYGLEIEKVQEVIRLKTIKKLPRSPHYILGVMNLRGNIIPVVGLREKFGLPSKENSEFSRIIVVIHRSRLVGIVVDEVSRVISINEENIEGNPDVIRDSTRALVRGVAKLEDQVIILVELDYLVFSAEEMESIENQ